jgi:hypothetical protein
MPDGTIATITDLLGKAQANAKLAKNKSVVSRYIAMAPASVHGLGNICPWSSPGCRFGCIATSGMGLVFKSIHRARLARRILWQTDRALFLEMYHYEMSQALAEARRRRQYVLMRPNLLSDIDYMRREPSIITNYPKAQFIDYTKDSKRMHRYLDGALPSNYHLTFSRSELNEADCFEILKRGGNVAAVFQVKYSSSGWKAPLPHEWHGLPVIDGDLDDMRHHDPRGKLGFIIGLRAKGKFRSGHDTTGFVIPTNS